MAPGPDRGKRRFMPAGALILHSPGEEGYDRRNDPMDVKEIQGGALSAVAGNKGKRDEGSGFSFQKILQEAQSNLQETKADAPRGPAGGAEIPPEGVLPVNLLKEIEDPFPFRLQGTRAAEKALDLLEQYQKAMENPRNTLREIHPLVQSLAEEVKGLVPWVEKMSPSDPLRGILTEAGILSSVEIEKFNRGDYL
jgi:hypothetical protein